MTRSRKLHKKETEKDKLYDALRALYCDGIRVHTGQLSAEKLLARTEDPTTNQRLLLTVIGDEDIESGIDPYNHRP